MNNIKKGILWLNVPNAEEKLLLLERLGRWLVDQIEMEREQSSP